MKKGLIVLITLLMVLSAEVAYAGQSQNYQLTPAQTQALEDAYRTGGLAGLVKVAKKTKPINLRYVMGKKEARAWE